MKWKRIMLLSAVAAAASAALVYGSFQDVLSVTSHISTGDVNIGIREYQQVGKKEKPYENPKTVMPGDVVSKIPRIRNFAQPCWIRAKITCSDDSGSEEAAAAVSVRGMPSGWVKRGDYYYYTEILGKKESVDLFRSLYIPSSWDERQQEKKFSVTVHADAVQAANFEPDFQAMSPWRDQKIQQCVHEENDKVSCVRENIQLSVEFRGDVYKLLSVPDDFFANFGKAMPGDILEDSISISNTADKEAEIFFCTGLEEQSEEQLDLLAHTGLELYLNGRSLYTGDLLAASLREPVSLGKFAPGESGVLDFRLKVPAELDNSYAVRNGAVKWIFSVQGDDWEAPGVAQYFPDSSKTESVKTGDEAAPQIYVVLILSALAVLAIIGVQKGGRDHEK